MTRHVLALLVIVIVLVPASPALAQGLPSGSIAGSVTSASDGQPLPGVTVTLRSPALQGVRQTVSAVNGDFLVANLAPGEYTVGLKMKGFQTVLWAGVLVGTSQLQELTVALSLEAVTESVTVTAPSEQVSMTGHSATTLTAAVVNTLPVSRTIESVVLLTPGVNANGAARAITISGGESYENSYNLDGIQAQDAQRGTLDPLYVEDAVAETTTLTSGVSAEYGRFSGGLVSVLTKTGGNVLSGSFRTTLINDAWSAQTPAGEHRTQDVTPIYEATLGGPVWKDRLWVFAAGRLVDQTTTGRTAPPTNIDFQTDRSEKRYELKLTASPFQSNTLTASVLRLDRDEHRVDPGMVPILDLASLWDRTTRQDLLLLNYTGTFSNWLFGEVSWGRRRLTISGFGSPYTDLVRGTPVFEGVTYREFNSAWECQACPNAADRRSSDHGVVKATALLSTTSMGSHTVVAGLEFFKASWVWNEYLTGSGYELVGTDVLFEGGELYPVLGPGTYLLYSAVLVPAAPDDARTKAAYVNDTWRMGNRLTFSLGLRLDKNAVRDFAGAFQSTEGTLSPRLGVAWDPSGQGHFRVTAGWGRYVSTVSEWQLGWASQPGIPAYFDYYYGGPPINVDPAVPRVNTADALRQVFQWFGITAPGQFPRAGIDPFNVFYPGVSYRMRGDLKPQRADEVTLGVSGSLRSQASFRVEAVSRTFSDFYAYRLDQSTGKVADRLGNLYDLRYLTSVNRPLERRYLALKTGLEARLAPSLVVSGSWTWSRTWGNQTSDTTNTGGLPQDVLTYPEYRDLAWNAPVGDLPQDVRHRVRLWATWDMTFVPARLGHLALTPLFSLDTGQPYGASGPVLVGPYVNNPGYVTPPPTVDYWFTRRDAYRTPTVTQLDLALNWSLSVGGVEFFVQPQVMNVLGGRAIVTSDRFYIDLGVRTAATSEDLQTFNPFTEKPVKGVHYALSPTFGKALGPSAYQQPRTFRISMGVRF
ncbi:MAG: TonB-dependent receptor [Acidobacteriia bacterium]|nr:TonB-dependent receptor [Terriglobia bacterium]